MRPRRLSRRRSMSCVSIGLPEHGSQSGDYGSSDCWSGGDDFRRPDGELDSDDSLLWSSDAASSDDDSEDDSDPATPVSVIDGLGLGLGLGGGGGGAAAAADALPSDDALLSAVPFGVLEGGADYRGGIEVLPASPRRRVAPAEEMHVSVGPGPGPRLGSDDLLLGPGPELAAAGTSSLEAYEASMTGGMQVPVNLQWRKGQLLGEGSFGKVYRGLNTVTGAW
jgi:hypothetical protein